MGPLPEPLQGNIHPSQLLIAPLYLQAGLGEFSLKLALIDELFIFFGNFLAEKIPLSPEAWSFNDHRAPCDHDLFDSLSAIHRRLVLPPGPNGLSHEGYLVLAPFNHLENDTG
ncbi:hypothetical protein CRG98_006195 [Punica granatum]|uniref:Uncharacterized protein n=1 Tax=Punica granatum TaxID=22663 RepID=A0A2I0KY81_PUNGR|nr:hypothetical protein CRG98_006195 [Punica granatum]